MDLLTSYQGIPHLTSAQFRSIIESITGAGSYIADIDEKMAIELAENNTVKIRSGVLIHHGGVMQIKKGTYDPATYQNGTQAMKRIDLLVARYTKSADTKIEKAEWVIIQGTPDEESPVAPAYTEGNMQDGDLVDDCPFAELHFDGINVVEVVMLVDVTENILTLKEIIKRMLEEIDKLNSKIDAGSIHELTLEGLTPYNDRCQITDGGYTKIGNLVIFQIRYVVNSSITANNYANMFEGLPNAASIRCACSDVKYQDHGANYTSEVTTTGTYIVHNTTAMANGDVHYASGCYFCEV